LELLHEAAPSAKAMALLLNPTNPNAATQSKTVQAAAQRLGLQLDVLNASSPGDFAPIFAKLHELQVAALMIVRMYSLAPNKSNSPNSLATTGSLRSARNANLPLPEA
jgi:ABC-type uncharacterized transport system substrate-binding protein